jgi:steroid 5-alpha reductase family enzyme
MRGAAVVLVTLGVAVPWTTTGAAAAAPFLGRCPPSTTIMSLSQRRTKKWTRQNHHPSTTTKSNIPVRGGGTTLPDFDNTPLWQSHAILWSINLLGYAWSLVKPHSHYHIDLLGTGAFAVAATLPLLLLSSSSRTDVVSRMPRHMMWSAAAVTLWSIKLSLFLFVRILSQQGQQDRRLVGIVDHPIYAAGFWLYSALWSVVVSLPHTLGMTAAAMASSSSSSISSSVVAAVVVVGPNQTNSLLALYAGAVLFLCGFVMETLADYQKWTFKHMNQNESHDNISTNDHAAFCNVGLWSISQHPNWCGNLFLWTGIFLMNAPALILAPRRSQAPPSFEIRRYRRLALASVGPLFLYHLFHSQATGRLLAPAWQATRERYGYGTDALYTNYVDTTPLIVPKLW